jgi:hypothetical protein
VPTWFGIPCRIGRARIWLTFVEGPGVYHEFGLLALFPRHDLQDAPPFVQLGTQFLLEYAGAVHLDCSSLSGDGRQRQC